jgi:hypothetical protein
MPAAAALTSRLQKKAQQTQPFVFHGKSMLHLALQKARSKRNGLMLNNVLAHQSMGRVQTIHYIFNLPYSAAYLEPLRIILLMM